MKVQRFSLYEGSLQARGISVMIDVFRAFTCEPLMYYYGARRIILEPDIEKCLAFGGNTILVGECNELPIEGFNLTNSPSLIMKKGSKYFNGRDIIHRTTSGVTGAAAALDNSHEVLLASFVNARATARYILNRKPEVVSIVAMGIRLREKAPEDEFCGDYIESMLNGKNYNHIEAVNKILSHESAQKFLRGDKSYLPGEDPVICLQRDLFNFTLSAQREGELITTRIINL
ncbi:2-phosphosulfolactate phosphatase [Candidatus Latescibacterota bacterium]